MLPAPAHAQALQGPEIDCARHDLLADDEAGRSGDPKGVCKLQVAPNRLLDRGVLHVLLQAFGIKADLAGDRHDGLFRHLLGGLHQSVVERDVLALLAGRERRAGREL